MISKKRSLPRLRTLVLAVALVALQMKAGEAHAAHIYEREVRFPDSSLAGYTRVETVAASDVWMIELRQAGRRWTVVRRGATVLSTVVKDDEEPTRSLRGSAEDDLEPLIRGFALDGEELVFTWPFPSFGRTAPPDATPDAERGELEIRAAVEPVEAERTSLPGLVWRVRYLLERFADGRLQATRITSELGNAGSRAMTVEETSKRVDARDAMSRVANAASVLERLPAAPEHGLAWPERVPRNPAPTPSEDSNGAIILCIPDLDRQVRVQRVDGAPQEKRPWRWLR